MSASSSKSTPKIDKGATIRYEVRRECEPGARGIERQPVVEEFGGLDRARLSALGHALDGPTSSADRFTGTVMVAQVFWVGDRRARTEIIDVVDERVAFRLLNEVKLPKPADLSVSMDRIQAEVDALAALGA